MRVSGTGPEPEARLREPQQRRDETANGLVWVMALVAVLGILASTILPDRVKARSEAFAVNEEARLKVLARGLLDSVRRTQLIPGTNDWVSAVSDELGASDVEVRQVFPQFPNETSTRRVYAIDPAFTPSSGNDRLPYAQTSAGVNSVSTNAPGIASRVMMVSSSHRGLALTIADGVQTATVFSNLWNWSYDPATRTPPVGFAANWAGQAHHLHIQRLNLANLFHHVTLENLTYTLNATEDATVGTPVQRHFLSGSLLKVSATNGTLHQLRVINRDAAFHLPAGTNSATAYYLTSSGVPKADLSLTAPTATTLANYDPGRDAFAGLLVAKGGSGPGENDATKIQKWYATAGDISINGVVTLTLSSAMKDFQTNKRGVVRAYLIECDTQGNGCAAIGTSVGVTLDRSDWDTTDSGTWIEVPISFGQVTYAATSSKRLGVAVLVGNNSADDMWFAYGTIVYNSRLLISDN